MKVAETNVLFDTGAQRGSDAGRTRPDLIPGIVSLRVGIRYAEGAAHYGEHNFEKGIPSSRYLASLTRHLEQWKSGDNEEDHLAAVAINVNGLIFNEEQVQRGALPAALLNHPRYEGFVWPDSPSKSPSLTTEQPSPSDTAHGQADSISLFLNGMRLLPGVWLCWVQDWRSECLRVLKDRFARVRLLPRLV